MTAREAIVAVGRAVLFDGSYLLLQKKLNRAAKAPQGIQSLSPDRSSKVAECELDTEGALAMVCVGLWCCREFM